VQGVARDQDEPLGGIMSKKIDPDLLEELAPEMYKLLKAILANIDYDFVFCAEVARKETSGCKQCRPKYAAHELIKYIEGE
jgi:hypothetical protein